MHRSQHGGGCLGLFLLLGFALVFVGGFYAWKWQKEDNLTRDSFSDSAIREGTEPSTNAVEVVMTRDWETPEDIQPEPVIPTLPIDPEEESISMPPAPAPEENALPLIPPPTPGINTNPPPEMVEEVEPVTFRPRPVIDLFEAQLQLDRLGFSAGPIDGVNGGQTKAALLAYQQSKRLPMTGTLDEATSENLILTRSALMNYTVTERDLETLVTTPSSWLGKSRLPRLGYQTLLETLSEQSHSNPKLIKRLNQNIDWSAVQAGQVIVLPDATRERPMKKGAFLRIRLSTRTLQVMDERAQILAHFPCSIARKVESRPEGELKIELLVEGPNYTFDPKRFPDTPEARSGSGKLILPPGPNNPVGAVWISLNLPGYGIHGTPEPEQVGRTESLGCFRLANWNAEYLLKMVSIGQSIHVVP